MHYQITKAFTALFSLFNETFVWILAVISSTIIEMDQFVNVFPFISW